MLIVIIVVAVVVALIAAGAMDNSTAPPVVSSGDRCYSCKKLENWWNNLEWYRRLYSWLWYLMNHLACMAEGCE